MKNKSILITSHKGKPVRSVKVNFLRVFFLVLFLLFGFAAYFIPSGIFKLKTTEQQQKNELGSQNTVLHQRIQSALQVLGHVKEQIGVLEAKKERVSALTGTGTDARSTRSQASSAGYDYTDKETPALLEHICRQDSIFTAFASRSKPGGNPFEYMPVCKPIPASTRVSKCFGETSDPFTGQQKPHYGTDFAAGAGTPVIATASGIVVRIENDNLWGWRVMIDHAGGISTMYAHLGTVTTGRGHRVKRGETIGTVGTSGLATGPHVHYEIRRNGRQEDPEEYFFPARVQ